MNNRFVVIFSEMRKAYIVKDTVSKFLVVSEDKETTWKSENLMSAVKLAKKVNSVKGVHRFLPNEYLETQVAQ